MLITHKGKKCLIISANLYLRRTVVLCSCALSSAPHSLSAAVASLSNPACLTQAWKTFYIFTLVHL